MGTVQLISIDEPHPKNKSRNRYAITVAEKNQFGNIEFWFNGPYNHPNKYPLLYAIAEILEEYRAYEIRRNIEKEKKEVSKFLGKKLESFNNENNEIEWVFAFDKKSKEDETEKMLAKGILPEGACTKITENEDEFYQKCSLIVMKIRSSNMDYDALLIISTEKIGSKLKSLLKKYGKGLPIVETKFDNFFDDKAVMAKMTAK
jgi:hypothetical protein